MESPLKVPTRCAVSIINPLPAIQQNIVCHNSPQNKTRHQTRRLIRSAAGLESKAQRT